MKSIKINEKFEFNPLASYDVIGDKVFIRIEEPNVIEKSSEDYIMFEDESARAVKAMIDSCDSLERLVEEFQLDENSTNIMRNFIEKLMEDKILYIKE